MNFYEGRYISRCSIILYCDQGNVVETSTSYFYDTDVVFPDKRTSATPRF